MHKPSKIRINKFGADHLHSLAASPQSNTRQLKYIIGYLKDLGAESVIEEPQYFDRDYLSEFSAFYGLSSKGYPNICKRLHFFASNINRSLFRKSIGGQQSSCKRLRDSYLGFVVIRPIPASPLGRTVLKWYPDDESKPPRVVSPSRNYTSHLAGIDIQVHGLAWQQQDSGVGACATVGLWSMLHSSAYDDHHAIPTTAEITQSAHKTASLGSRIFPSHGLTLQQILEAIKEHRLAPLVLSGELNSSGNFGFGRERFSTSCASLIRSGYPVLAIGQLEGVGGHAVCISGFRESVPPSVGQNDVAFADKDIEYIYIHDDNVGPNVRFKIEDSGPGLPIKLTPSPPPTVTPLTTANYPSFKPTQLIAATHDDLRTSPDTLSTVGFSAAKMICSNLNTVLDKIGYAGTGFMISNRFIKLNEFLGGELERMYPDANDRLILSRVRLNLSERACPMSLHIGLVRIGLSDTTQVLDILYDTTDSDRNHSAFAHVAYSPIVALIVKKMTTLKQMDLGIQVKGH